MWFEVLRFMQGVPFSETNDNYNIDTELNFSKIRSSRWRSPRWQPQSPQAATTTIALVAEVVADTPEAADSQAEASQEVAVDTKQFRPDTKRQRAHPLTRSSWNRSDRSCSEKNSPHRRRLEDTEAAAAAEASAHRTVPQASSTAPRPRNTECPVTNSAWSASI
ncbi:unnamed protein product [Acanthoscelides obtectus]|uniref:Uncharacterized protein n=1 Tax=Acanthoscelides obtectus TaxID=200917 RepID=A0A9P0P4Z3_ACAOB|nr:unnamed protein product [Acanthoscelides obtectus]CAK1676742.1 hypothetical protein AOBTE_LOCUS30919 [Acanthoscelides obtectus]